MTAVVILCIILGAVIAGACVALRSERAGRRRAEAALSDALVGRARLEERLRQEADVSARRSAEAEQRFRSLATGILMESAQVLQRQNSQGIAAALQPVKENFEMFRRAYEERSERETADRTAFAGRLRDMMELNDTVRRETRRLADALRGNSRVQGEWGEMILQTILERCGLRQGYEFTVQGAVTDDAGRKLRPDVIINYPGGRRIVVDSKVSIQSYLGMLDADTDEQRRSCARGHVASVRKHIAELRAKNYQDCMGEAQPEFVLMFMPHEGAFLAAMQLDDTLWQTAYDANVLIVSPTHLMAVVRLVDQMWRRDRQERNAQEIARQAGMMLDKFRGLIHDMERIDKSLADARASWNDAFAKLSTGSGNLVSRAEHLGELGAKTKKSRETLL